MVASLQFLSAQSNESTKTIESVYRDNLLNVSQVSFNTPIKNVSDYSHCPA